MSLGLRNGEYKRSRGECCSATEVETHCGNIRPNLDHADRIVEDLRFQPMRRDIVKKRAKIGCLGAG